MIPILRFAHIFSAIFWVGTTLFMVFFLQPTVAALGADGGKVMRTLLNGTRFNAVIAASAILTVLAGLGLYGPITSWSADVMLGSRLPLTIGAIAGIAAGGVGFAGTGRASRQLAALGAEMAAQKGKPNSAQLEQMGMLQAKLRQHSRVTAVLMVIAVIGMTW